VKRRSRASSLLLITVLLVLAGGSQASAAGPYTLHLSTGLTLAGTVRDADGDPVAGAEVGVCTSTDDCFVSTDISAADGTYTVRGLVAGTYYVQAVPAEGVNALRSWYDGTPSGSHDPEAAITVLVDGDVDGIDLSLPDGFRITGVVKDPEGDPVAGVTVGAAGSSVPSDTSGVYEIVGLEPGTYNLSVYTPDNGEFPSGWLANGTVTESEDDATPTDVVDADVTAVDITLYRGRTISGHVTAPAGTPIEVSALDASIRYTFLVGAGGVFTVRGLFPGAYHLLFAVPENSVDSQFPYGIFNGNGKQLVAQDKPGVAIDVTAGSVTGVSAVLPALPSIGGTVRDANGPVAGAGIWACDPDNGCAAVHTAGDGTFRARNVPPGAYTIGAGAAGHVLVSYSAGRSIPDVDSGTPVAVGSSSVSVGIVLPLGGSIGGSVTGQGGVPLAGIDVSAGPSSGGISEFGPGGTVTGADGLFTVEGLADGGYVLAASAPWNSDYGFGYWSDAGTTQDVDDATVVYVDDATAPVVRAPKAALAGGTQLGTTSVPVRITWTATDPGSGLSSFRLQQSTNGGAWSTVASPLVATTTRSLTPSSTRTYRFRVRGADFSGNTSADVAGASLRVLRKVQGASSITYRRTWSTTKATAASGGSHRTTTASNASATFSFTGRSVAWVARRGSGYGKAKVYLDGTLVATVDLGGAGSWRRVVYAWNAPPSGRHKLMVVNLATSGRPRISVDAFAVIR
jgi:hypothetical protein